MFSYVFNINNTKSMSAKCKDYITWALNLQVAETLIAQTDARPVRFSTQAFRFPPSFEVSGTCFLLIALAAIEGAMQD